MEYTLKNFKPEINFQEQTVVFYEKLENGEIQEGTTLEEMIRVSIERLTHLNGKFPCRENSLAITKLEEALHWLNHRTADRQNRGVEGQHKA